MRELKGLVWVILEHSPGETLWTWLAALVSGPSCSEFLRDILQQHGGHVPASSSVSLTLRHLYVMVRRSILCMPTFCELLHQSCSQWRQADQLGGPLQEAS